MNDIFVRSVPLPGRIKAMTSEDAEGDYNVYINAALSDSGKRTALRHELDHIAKYHFRSAKTVEECEKEIVAV